MTHLVNDMFLNKRITAKQKYGILICLPKSQPSPTPDTYHPISLLNTEHKLLARIMVHRLKPILAEQLSTGQHCGIPGRSILDALPTVRDVIVYHETTQTTFCLLSLEFDKHLIAYRTTICSNCYYDTGSSTWFLETANHVWPNTCVGANKWYPCRNNRHPKWNKARMPTKYVPKCNVTTPSCETPGGITPRYEDRTAASEDNGLSIPRWCIGFRHGPNNLHYNPTCHQHIRTGQ